MEVCVSVHHLFCVPLLTCAGQDFVCRQGCCSFSQIRMSMISTCQVCGCYSMILCGCSSLICSSQVSVRAVCLCVIWALFPPGPHALPPAGKLRRYVFRGERGGGVFVFAAFGFWLSIWIFPFWLSVNNVVLLFLCAGGVFA